MTRVYIRRLHHASVFFFFFRTHPFLASRNNRMHRSLDPSPSKSIVDYRRTRSSLAMHAAVRNIFANRDKISLRHFLLLTLLFFSRRVKDAYFARYFAPSRVSFGKISIVTIRVTKRLRRGVTCASASAALVQYIYQLVRPVWYSRNLSNPGDRISTGTFHANIFIIDGLSQYAITTTKIFI